MNNTQKISATPLQIEGAKKIMKLITASRQQLKEIDAKYSNERAKKGQNINSRAE